MIFILILLVTAVSPLRAEEPATFAQAKQMAKDQGKLLLVDFYTEWCGPCKRFQAAAKTSEDLHAGLEKVVFISIDCEKGEGVELAKHYGVRSFPNYMLAGVEGEPIYRWVGYGTVDGFLGKLETGLKDPTTLAEKTSRFQENPTASDAETLASAAAAASDQVASAQWYEKAAELAGGGYEMEIFFAKFQGFRSGAFTKEELIAAADTVMSKGDQQEKFQVYAAQPFLAKATGIDSLAYRYVDDFWKELKDNDDPDVQQMRQRVQLDRALYIEKNPEKAAELKYASMPVGWMEDADGLNEYAWWCFENKVDLQRAEELAREGVGMATEGSQKAAILDTLAEICNVRGNCNEAVTLTEEAIQNDPGNAYYKKQLERFRELLKKSG